MIKGYKLVSQLKDGSIGPLFVDKKSRFTIGKWMKAKAIKQKGFAFRPGFHAVADKFAPHLSKKDRVWCEVSLKGVKEHVRPKNHGGLWYTAKQMRIDKVLA